MLNTNNSQLWLPQSDRLMLHKVLSHILLRGHINNLSLERVCHTSSSLDDLFIKPMSELNSQKMLKEKKKFTVELVLKFIDTCIFR